MRLEKMEEEQKEYINELKQYSIKPFFVVHHRPTGEMKPWETEFNFPLDYYSILSREIVFDIDSEVWNDCKEAAMSICGSLDNLKIPYNLYLSGGKGIHIHVFFNIPNIDEKFLKDVGDSEISYKNIRFYFFNYILDKAEIPSNLRGPGKFLDTLCVNWDDRKKGHIIRCCGGRKFQKDGKINYKTYLENVKQIPDRKNIILPEQVKFPPKIEFWNIHQRLFDNFLEDWHKEHVKKVNSEEKVYFKLEYGEYTKLPCIDKILQGASEGKRNILAGTLACACVLDNLPESETLKLLEQFVNNCEPGITIDEAKKWVDWYKQQQYVRWTCSYAKELGYCSSDVCSCKLLNKKKEKVWNFLENKDLTKFIIEIIQNKIQGRQYCGVIKEEKNLFHIFLVFLSAYKDPQNRKLSEESSVGKSHIVLVMVPFFPSEDFIIGNLTPKAIYYMAEEIDGQLVTNLEGKIIIILEESQAKDLLAELKPILSHDIKTLPYRYTDTNLKKTITVHITGHPVYIGLSVYNDREHEQSTREWEINPLNNSEKFQMVKENISYANPFTKDILHPDTDLLKEAVKEIKLKAKDLSVINIWAPKVLACFKSNEPRIQRDAKRICSMIELVSLLYYRQRVIIIESEKKAILTTKQDIINAIECCEDSIFNVVVGISKKQQEFFEKVLLNETELTYKRVFEKFRSICGRTLKDETIKNQYIFSLQRAGFINLVPSPGDKREKIIELNTYLKDFDFEKPLNDFQEKIRNLEITEDEIKDYYEKCALNINIQKGGSFKNNEIRIEKEVVDWAYLLNSINL